jgi:hypothetical protein
MADGFIVRRGGKATEQALAPTITETETTTSSFKFTLKNEDTDKAIIRYRIDDIDDEGEIIELAGGATSDDIEITGLDGGTEYIVFATANVTGKIKSNVTQLAIETDPVFEYGVQWTQSTDTVIRLDDADGLSRSDFDTIEPWASMRRCMVNDDRSINYYIDPDDPDDIGEVVNTGSYTTGDPADYTGGDGQVMVEIPKFFYKTAEPSTGVYQWYVSMTDLPGYDVHPAFVTGEQTRDNIYIGAFEGTAATSTGTLRSISGVQPLGFRTIDQFRTQAQDRGTGWQLQTYFATNALQVLYLVEYADFDSQDNIGKGVVDKSFSASNLSENTGATIFLGNASGRESGTDGLTSISYRGIENLWGNIYTWLDGINRDGDDVFVSNEGFETAKKTSPYVLLTNNLLSGVNTFPTDITFPDFLISASGGSSSSHLHDVHDTRNTDDRIVRYGGAFNEGLNGGIFAIGPSRDITTSGSTHGSRIQIL